MTKTIVRRAHPKAMRRTSTPITAPIGAITKEITLVPVAIAVMPLKIRTIFE